MTNKSIQIHLIMITLLLSPISHNAQNRPSYSNHTCHVEGVIDDILIKDLDNNSKRDLLVVHHQADKRNINPRRWISLFLQKNDTIGPKASQRLSVDRGQIVFDLCDLDQDNIPELIFLKNDGLEIWKMSDSGFTPSPHLFIKTSSVFLSHDPIRLKYYKLAFHFDNHNNPILIVPKSAEMALFTRNRSGQYDLSQNLYTGPHFTLTNENPLQLFVNLPQTVLDDFNGDKIRDLHFLSKDRMDVFLQYPHEQFIDSSSIKPPSFRYRIDLMKENLSSVEKIAPATMKFKIFDLNQDNRSDILLIHAPRAGFTAHISQIHIYLNRWGKFPSLPDEIITAENLNGEHVVGDFNQDGYKDLALLQFKIGWFQAIKFLFTRKVDFVLNFFLMDKNETYPEKPNRSISFSKRLKIRDLIHSFQNLFTIEGDFNGDTLSDMLIHADSDHYLIIPAEGKMLFSKKNLFKINVPTSDEFKVEDINNDSFSDICLWYPDILSRLGEFHLVMSSK